MKKFTLCILPLFLFSFFLSPFSLCAQVQLDDSSFENGWIPLTGANGPFLEYNTPFFYTLNSLFARPNEPHAADLTAFRDGNAQDKNYCIKLVSGRIPVGEYVFLPGMVGTINEGFVEEFLGSGGNITITRDWYGNETPHALEGWYKYKPVNGDSALIDIGFNNFVEKMIIKETVNNWKFFRIPIPEQYWDNYFSDIRVLFVASAGVNFEKLMECKGQLGSTLWIDNIYLNYSYQPDGIKQNLFSTLKANAFPNPANEVLHIELNENFNGKIRVYNSLGSLIMEENITGTQGRLNTSNLATGNYSYKLMNDNIIFAQGRFVVTK